MPYEESQTAPTKASAQPLVVVRKESRRGGVMTFRRHGLATVCVALFTMLASVLVSVGTSGSAFAATHTPGVTSKTITIGVVNTETGASAGNYAPYLIGLQVEVNKINATGGIYGRKIKLITQDDQNVPADNLAATQSLVQARKVFAVINLAPGDPPTLSYLNSAGVPDINAGSSPTEGLPTNFGIFGVYADLLHGPRTATLFPQVLKSMGAHNIGVIAYGSIAASIDEASSAYLGAKVTPGLTAAYENLTLPRPIPDWTPYVLAMKAANVDGFFTGLDVATTMAFLQAAQQQGLTLKSFIAIGYNASLLTQPENSIAQGMTVGSAFLPTELNTPATRIRTQIFNKYGAPGPVNPTAVPGYVAGLLLQEGLTVAGKKLTRTSFINNLRQVKNWT
ncbi:MAG: Extracellular ligand-binding receptor, partial [Acidimicrobiaceae bacterium]|nr:Extracellular ligand-binding receptor [Acidimicrobiaceae bacterium]